MRLVALALLLPLLGAGPALAAVPSPLVAPDREAAGAMPGRPGEFDAAWHEWSPRRSPPAMESAAMAYDTSAELMVMFGGRATDLPSHTVGNTWTWDGSHWAQLHPGSHPSPREWHAMAYDPGRDQIVLFGGYDGEILGDTWIYDDGTWSRREPPASPSPRYSHMMAFDPVSQQVLLFGGSTDIVGEPSDETWAWDGSTWTELHPAASPSARAYGRLAYDPSRGRLVTFGGQTSHRNLDDTWSWDGATWAREPSRITPTKIRYGMATLGRHVVMNGGTFHSAEDDAWLLKGNGWHQIYPSGPWPSDRWNPAMEWDPTHHEVVLFGGLQFVDNTWTLKP